ncbi:hypothetical protein ACTI_30520 [Actinoplanes sp. OR16]|uniref:DUF305 domain-containing protein n=1 Tax=Actinoplanes sp. OR16 TaxID=946334 RepID=UPI000F6BFC00|nr:DUF305 domain-containing protein [Actinoplanes sp. OR16]BBH66367.1 hypothetical protein ACTI_30520 [Actinoplanes sp. OR16]
MNRRHTRSLATATLTVLATAGIALAACTGSTEKPEAAAPSASSSPVPVLLPGRPGESAAVSDSDQVKALDGSVYNSIDVAYVQMMIAHHEQALVMADLAPGRASNTGLKRLADRMSAAQQLEIDYFKSWLKDRNQPESDPSHDHSSMPGGQSDAEIAALTAASGAEFDRMFVAMMTEHHQGAQQMAGDLLRSGSDERLSELANESAVEQVSEIRRMAELGIR